VIDLSAISHELLDRARIAHLATADQYARPHVIPVVFVWGEGRFYFPLDRKPKREDDWHLLRRVRNIETNGRVSIVIDHYDEDWSKLAWVLLEGVASILEDGVERETAMKWLGAKYPQYADGSLEGRPVVRVVIERTVQWSAADARR
jgi:PPOX class probable F420-dependent enzyme